VTDNTTILLSVQLHELIQGRIEGLERGLVAATGNENPSGIQNKAWLEGMYRVT